jgi:CelD/BcsL family acetyltransferase involved in cellulose biosynthesis
MGEHEQHIVSESGHRENAELRWCQRPSEHEQYDGLRALGGPRARRQPQGATRSEDMTAVGSGLRRSHRFKQIQALECWRPPGYLPSRDRAAIVRPRVGVIPVWVSVARWRAWQLQVTAQVAVSGMNDELAGDGGVLTVPALDSWASQWDQLVDLSPIPSPFLRSWWLTGVSGPRPRFLLAIHGDRLLGGLALEERRRLGLPCLRMMGTGSLCPDHLDLLARPGHEDAVARAVRAWLQRPGPRLLDMDGISADSLLATALPGPVRCEPQVGAPWAGLPDDPKTYLAARPRGVRKTLRQASARFTAEGAGHRVSRGASVAQSLATLRRLHEAQWGDQSRFLPDFDRFAAACCLGAEHDEVAVHELNADGTVIAIMVSFEVAGRVSLYQSARLTDFRWRDATNLLLATIISDACDRGFAEVDFLRGDEVYKKNFATERRELLRLRTANGRTGRAALAMEAAVRKAKRVANHYSGNRPLWRHGIARGRPPHGKGNDGST